MFRTFCASEVKKTTISSWEAAEKEEPMSILRTRTALIGVTFVAFAMANGSALAQHKHHTPEELMELLKTAAPPAILEGATVLDMKEDGSMAVLRKGANGWTCMDPGGAPMCGDANAMEWLHALVSKGPAPQKLGFVYMLRGDNGASNTDPYATEEKPDNNWVKTASHVMIVGAEAKALTQTYPRDSKPDPHKPYVMWPGSPYEHLMLPVQ
jgi:hypothetical protein